MQANRRGDLGQRVAMSTVRRRHPGAAVGMPVSDRRKIQDLTPNALPFAAGQISCWRTTVAALARENIYSVGSELEAD